MSIHTKTASGSLPTGTIRTKERRSAETRETRRGARSKARKVRDRARGTFMPRHVPEPLQADAANTVREALPLSMLLDVEFDHDEFDETALGHARSMARAVCREEDEARWA